MSSRRWMRHGRRTAALVWIGGLVLAVLASLSPGSVALGAAAGDDPPQSLPGPAAPRDTTGQAALAWRVKHPTRAASLLQADRSVYRVIDGEAISFYYGNVYLDRDTVVVRADSAHVFRDRNVVRLFENVRIRHHQTRIASDWAEYRRDLGEADLRGHVRVVEAAMLATARRGELREDMQLLRLFDDAVTIAPEYTVRADTLLRDRRLEFAEAFGHVRVMDPDAGSLVTGDHGRFAADGTWAEVDENPALETREGGEPVRSVARRMRFYRAEERVVMTDSVRIAQGRLRAFADTAISFGKDRMLLLGAPHLEQGDRSRMFGDQIEFFYRDGALYRVILLGDARMEDTEPDSLAAIYRGLPPLDVVEGDSITVHLRDGKIRRTDVVGRAHSIYVPVDVEDEISYNDVRGDTLTINFKDQRVRDVEVMGAMTGNYRFARVAAMRGPQPAPLDSAAVDSLAAIADTLAADSLAATPGEPETVAMADTLVAGDVDTLAAAAPDTFSFTDHAEDVVYSGHRVLFDMPKRSISISRDASLTYGTMTLSARDVILDTDSRELYADGDPILEDAQTIVGKQMGYDFANKTGAVKRGVTGFDGYYYVGDAINRYPDGSLKICSGKMTSCDRDEPHYHFWANKMKMRMGDRVVAAPIVMKVGHVPVFALPFYFKSLKEGRRSGILFPNFNFGWSSREGRYIRDFGYYWATNEYTDFTFEVDYNERRELAWRVRNRYVKRYGYNGSFEYNQLKKLDEDATTGDEWQFKWAHSQPKLFDDYKFSANVAMASRELSRNNLARNTGRDVISGQLKSSAYVSRSWDWGAGSLNASRTEYTNASDDDPTTDKQISSMTLPSFSLSFKQWTLGRQLGPGEKGSFLGDLGRSTNFTQRYGATNSVAETEDVKTTNYAANGSWGLTVRPDRVGIFNVNFGASSSWAWTRNDIDGSRYVAESEEGLGDDSYEDISDVTETSRPTLSFNSGVSTTLYGVFPVRIGALQALRHTLNVSVGTSYRPQLGSKQNSSNTYSFAVGNRFDAKYLSRGERDSTATEKKIDGLIDWSLRTSYNPDLDRMWGNISSGVSFKPGRSRNLSFKLNQTIDPYAMHVTSTKFSYGFGFSGRLDTGYEGQERADERSDAIERLGPTAADSLGFAPSDTAGYDQDWPDDWQTGDDPGRDDGFYGGNFGSVGAGDSGGPGGRDQTEGGRFIPWTLGGSLSMSTSSSSDKTTARGSLNLSSQLTRDWSFRYSASFDLEAGTTTRQEYRLGRDLHCWRLEFMRTVSSSISEFGFRFYLKAIPELKLTRGKDDLMGSAVGAGSFY